MQMTLKAYIKNPAGEGSRTHMVGQAEAAKAMYTDKYNKMMLKTAGALEHKMYKNEDGTRYILLIKLPSESINGIVYDVGIEFYTKDDVDVKRTNLDEYFIRFFSNDPNFTYTYAYTFKKNKMIIPELESKLDPRSLKERPKVTNPHTEIGYCKSLYLAQLFFDMKGLTNKALWYNAPKISASALRSGVMATANKLVQVERLRKLQSIAKKGSIHIGDVNDLDNLDFKVKQAKSVKDAQDTMQRIYAGKTKPIRKVGFVRKVKRIG